MLALSRLCCPQCVALTDQGEGKLLRYLNTQARRVPHARLDVLRIVEELPTNVLIYDTNFVNTWDFLEPPSPPFPLHVAIVCITASQCQPGHLLWLSSSELSCARLQRPPRGVKPGREQADFKCEDRTW